MRTKVVPVARFICSSCLCFGLWLLGRRLWLALVALAVPCGPLTGWPPRATCHAADANMYARQAPTGVDKMTQTMLLGSFVEADDGSAQAHDE
ncbi:hypothetical protein V8C86DRAFT_606211 [Haematococcus lacustris]